MLLTYYIVLSSLVKSLLLAYMIIASSFFLTTGPKMACHVICGRTAVEPNVHFIATLPENIKFLVPKHPIT